MTRGNWRPERLWMSQLNDAKSEFDDDQCPVPQCD